MRIDRRRFIYGMFWAGIVATGSCAPFHKFNQTRRSIREQNKEIQPKTPEGNQQKPSTRER